LGIECVKKTDEKSRGNDMVGRDSRRSVESSFANIRAKRPDRLTHAAKETALCITASWHLQTPGFKESRDPSDPNPTLVRLTRRPGTFLPSLHRSDNLSFKFCFAAIYANYAEYIGAWNHEADDWTRFGT
jgi:hypothetical protein